ncbi:MAG TPA: NTP transferase domain-containing protein [Thermoanaerobaculia bacterium]|nr:NTP transferase domain-containing protein [Thermoanaerobaculia bacterium]
MSARSAGPHRSPPRAVPERPRMAVVLAAGKGTRMRSAVPKVLHRAAGRPLLAWVLDAARAARCARILVVVGHGAEQVREELGASDVSWVTQAEQLGTGHALAQAGELVAGEALLLVLSGDAPLVTPATLERLAAAAGAAGDGAAGWGAMAVAELPEPGSLGRVVGAPDGADGTDGADGADGNHRDRRQRQRLVRVVEAADASPAELALTTVNAGFYALPAPEIFTYLGRLGTANAKGELYLTDAVSAAAAAGRRIELVALADRWEALGVNDRRELAQAHRLLLDRHMETLMGAGVTMLDPARTVVEATVCVGADTVLHPGVSLLGRTRVGAGCTLHQGAWLRDTGLGEGVTVEPYSVLDGAEVGDFCRVGPFARLRPASRLLKGARVGNFVELKNAELGEGSRAGHLSYLGDVTVGEGANIGAGTVTCNFDGASKHPSAIGRGAFIGSNTLLVAPVKVGDGAATAAGSVITRDVPAAALAVGRARQKNLAGRAAGLGGKRRRGGQGGQGCDTEEES